MAPSFGPNLYSRCGFVQGCIVDVFFPDGSWRRGQVVNRYRPGMENLNVPEILDVHQLCYEVVLAPEPAQANILTIRVDSKNIREVVSDHMRKVAS